MKLRDELPLHHRKPHDTERDLGPSKEAHGILQTLRPRDTAQGQAQDQAPSQRRQEKTAVHSQSPPGDSSRLNTGTDAVPSCNRPCRCPCCFKWFKQKSDIETHLWVSASGRQRKGGKPTQHICHVCKQVFDTAPHLLGHLHSHGFILAYVCVNCEFDSAGEHAESDFENHATRRGHAHDPIVEVIPGHTGSKDGQHSQCYFCKKYFQRTKELAEHRRAMHRREAPFQCLAPECDITRFSSDILISHIDRAHPNSHELSEAVLAEKPYRCRHEPCERAFNKDLECIRHEQAHITTIDWYCDQCDRKFRRRDDLIRHAKARHGGISNEQLEPQSSLWDKQDVSKVRDRENSPSPAPRPQHDKDRRDPSSSGTHLTKRFAAGAHVAATALKRHATKGAMIPVSEASTQQTIMRTDPALWHHLPYAEAPLLPQSATAVVGSPEITQRTRKSPPIAGSYGVMAQHQPRPDSPARVVPCNHCRKFLLNCKH